MCIHIAQCAQLIVTFTLVNDYAELRIEIFRVLLYKWPVRGSKAPLLQIHPVKKKREQEEEQNEGYCLLSLFGQNG